MTSSYQIFGRRKILGLGLYVKRKRSTNESVRDNPPESKDKHIIQGFIRVLSKNIIGSRREIKNENKK